MLQIPLWIMPSACDYTAARYDKKPWLPMKRSVICSQHFIGGQKSDHPHDPAYIPTLFPPCYKSRQEEILLRNSCQDDSKSIPNSNVESNSNQNVGSIPERKIVEVLCFDGQQYRYIYRGTDCVLNIKLELQSEVDIFVSMEEFANLELADIKPSQSALVDLIVPDNVSNEACSEEIAQPLEPVLHELNVKEEIEDSHVLCLVTERSTSEADRMKDHGEVLPEYFVQACLENREVYNCDICSRTFKNKFPLQKHQRLHHKGLLSKCHLCSKTFENKFLLGEHFKHHTDKKTHSCSDCGTLFNEVGNLKIHRQRVHKKETLFKCELCAKEFVTEDVLKYHLRGPQGKFCCV